MILASLISFYLTSIYDHSVHEAFSKIVQNQMRQLRALEHMLDLVTAVNDAARLNPHPHTRSLDMSRARNWIRSSCVIFTIRSFLPPTPSQSKVKYPSCAAMLSTSTQTFHLFMGTYGASRSHAYTIVFRLSRSDPSPVLDSMSHCAIELSIGLVLYLKDINPTTALICILKKESRINGGELVARLVHARSNCARVV